MIFVAYYITCYIYYTIKVAIENEELTAQDLLMSLMFCWLAAPIILISYLIRLLDKWSDKLEHLVIYRKD